MTLPAVETPNSSSETLDRSPAALAWYRVVQWSVTTLLSSAYDFRASGRENIPKTGSALLVCNHLSHLDVFMLGVLLQRPLNYVARSTLFLPVLGPLITSVGGFPIQRDGLGASGMKETLRRLKRGGIVALFPEGTRSRDGELGELKAGISVLAARAKTRVIPAAVAGSFESWPRTERFPKPHPLHIHFGPTLAEETIAGRSAEEMTDLIRERILECRAIARDRLNRRRGRGGTRI